ncbi:hypothetical protein ACFE04_018949 [Oxalis oulophora]
MATGARSFESICMNEVNWLVWWLDGKSRYAIDRLRGLKASGSHVVLAHPLTHHVTGLVGENGGVPVKEFKLGSELCDWNMQNMYLQKYGNSYPGENINFELPLSGGFDHQMEALTPMQPPKTYYNVALVDNQSMNGMLTGANSSNLSSQQFEGKGLVEKNGGVPVKEFKLGSELCDWNMQNMYLQKYGNSYPGENINFKLPLSGGFGHQMEALTPMQPPKTYYNVALVDNQSMNEMLTGPNSSNLSSQQFEGKGLVEKNGGVPVKEFKLGSELCDWNMQNMYLQKYGNSYPGENINFELPLSGGFDYQMEALTPMQPPKTYYNVALVDNQSMNGMLTGPNSSNLSSQQFEGKVSCDQ